MNATPTTSHKNQILNKKSWMADYCTDGIFTIQASHEFDNKSWLFLNSAILKMITEVLLFHYCTNKTTSFGGSKHGNPFLDSIFILFCRTKCWSMLKDREKLGIDKKHRLFKIDEKNLNFSKSFNFCHVRIHSDVQIIFILFLGQMHFDIIFFWWNLTLWLILIHLCDEWTSSSDTIHTILLMSDLGGVKNNWRRCGISKFLVNQFELNHVALHWHP